MDYHHAPFHYMAVFWWLLLGCRTRFQTGPNGKVGDRRIWSQVTSSTTPLGCCDEEPGVWSLLGGQLPRKGWFTSSLSLKNDPGNSKNW